METWSWVGFSPFTTWTRTQRYPGYHFYSNQRLTWEPPGEFLDCVGVLGVVMILCKCIGLCMCVCVCVCMCVPPRSYKNCAQSWQNHRIVNSEVLSFSFGFILSIPITHNSGIYFEYSQIHTIWVSPFHLSFTFLQPSIFIFCSVLFFPSAFYCVHSCT